MFDFVHERKRLVQIILALIILPFAFWGVDSYRNSGNDNALATVEGSKITPQEFENALRQQQSRLREMMGGNVDAETLNSPELRSAVLDSLVQQRLLAVRAREIGLTISDDQMRQIISGIESFQTDGSFDKTRYEAALASQNLSPAMFENLLRTELLGQQLRDVFVQNGYASSSVTDNLIKLNEQQREINIYNVSVQPFIAKAKVDEAELKKYYEANQKEFQTPEQVKVEYVRLSAEGLMGKVDVTDDEARKYYESHKSEFGAPEQRQAAHILIAAAVTDPQSKQDAAKAKAKKLLQQLRQNPAKFAELAKQNSQDPGSASNGGDLGFFAQDGTMVKPFEDAVFALKQGEVSDLVQSEFGYHIIKLLAVKPSGIQSFDKVRANLVSKLKLQKAMDKFAELAEGFTEAVYTQSDSLKPAAELIGAKVEQSGWLLKGAPPSEQWPVQLQQAIFSDEVIKDKRNTTAIEVGSNALEAARVLEHKPAAVRGFDEVRDMISQKLVRQQAAELAVKQGESQLKQLQQGGKPEIAWAPVQTVSRMQRLNLDTELVREIFRANPARLPQYVGAEAGQGGYVLVRINAVKDAPQPEDAKRASYMQQLRVMTGQELFRDYLSGVQQKAKIKVTQTGAEPVQP